MIKMTLDIKCTDKSRVQEEQLVGYLLRAIAGVTANNKGIITNYTFEIGSKSVSDTETE